jgi:hypothetical protein
MDCTKKAQAGEPLEHGDVLLFIEDEVELAADPVGREAPDFRPRQSHRG